MASPQIASSQRVDQEPARVNVWRVLVMLAALVAVVVGLLLIATSAV